MALSEGKPLAVEPSGNLMGFSIRILDAAYSDPISGPSFVADGGWKVYEPRVPRAPGTGPVAVDGLILLTPEDELARSVGAEALAKFASAIEGALQEAVSATKPGRGRDLLVDARIYPGGSKGFQIAARPAEDFGPFVQALYERLEKIPAPGIRGEPVQFQIQFRVWGGSGSEQKTQSGSTNDGGPPRP